MTERERFEKWINTLDKQTLVTMTAKQARTIEELQAAKSTSFTMPDRMDYELHGDTVISNPFVDGYNQALSDVISMNEEYANSTVSDGWIPVSARPPERKQGNKIWATDGITQFECEFDDDFWCNIFGNEFTHWRELPAAPELK